MRLINPIAGHKTNWKNNCIKEIFNLIHIVSLKLQLFNLQFAILISFKVYIYLPYLGWGPLLLIFLHWHPNPLHQGVVLLPFLSFVFFGFTFFTSFFLHFFLRSKWLSVGSTFCKRGRAQSVFFNTEWFCSFLYQTTKLCANLNNEHIWDQSICFQVLSLKPWAG